jgi:uncharacterized RmlC-like cupin family protein
MMIKSPPIQHRPRCGRPTLLFRLHPVDAGDVQFIPPDVPHQSINLSATEAARAIVVRNDPNEQQHVILCDPSDDD